MNGWGPRHRLRWIVDNVRRAGLRGLWFELTSRLAPSGRADKQRRMADDAAFDAQGYDTSARLALDRLEIVGDTSASRHYEATPSYDFETIMRTVDLDPAGATFVDLGSGKGRLILLAADLPFKAIIGIEFARELHEIACANLARRAERTGPDKRITLLHQDATRMAIPAGPIVYLLNNSFGPPALTQVARAIHAAWEADPRPIRIVYINAQHPEEWTGNGFREIATGPDFRFVIYAPEEG